MRNAQTKEFEDIINQLYVESGMTMEEFWNRMQTWPMRVLGGEKHYASRWSYGDNGTTYYQVTILIETGQQQHQHQQSEQVFDPLCVFGYDDLESWSCKF